MEFQQRSVHQTQVGGPSAAAAPSPGKRSRGRDFSWIRFSFVVLLFSSTVLIVAVIFLLFRGSPTNEAKYVNTKGLQSVFLTDGQVYFGNITSLNSQYLRLDNIYYLRVNQQVQPNQSTSTTNSNDVSLVKLGCELHGPEDQMVINQSQVSFWENLTSTGQVAKAVAAYVKQNPNGQTCTTSSTSTTPAATTPSTSK